MTPPLFPLLRTSFPPSRKVSALLGTYFRSGWAFLIPYLAAYLLYAWLDGPVNPNRVGDSFIDGISESRSPENSAFGLQPSEFSPPSLLHVYWSLHAIHLILATTAIVTWWHGRRRGAGDRRLNESLASHEASGINLPATRYSLLSTLPQIVPWLLLGLLYYIPGLYLEWPSDPWEHLRRINEWHNLDRITAHSSWTKSSYLMPYSLTASATGLLQLNQLSLYYTGICLLLSWQYYRLARAIGLSACASFVFVLLNVLTFANDIFSFYRYYGLSSSIWAQIGAIAIIRLAIETVSCRSAGTIIGGSTITESAFSTRFFFAVGSSTGLLLLLVTFNHLQGLAIASLGVGAVFIWRATTFTKNGPAWLIICMVIVNGLFLVFYHRSPLVESLQATGWLNAIYGFNLYEWPSPAATRAMAIFGGIGILGQLAGLRLIAKRHIAGWLTLIPTLALSMPLISVPFATMISEQPSGIAVFHRVLFATPTCLALVTLFSERVGNARTLTVPDRTLWLVANPRIAKAACAPMIVSFLLFICTTSDRIWASLAKLPDDLTLRPTWDTIAHYSTITRPDTPGAFVSNAIVGSVSDNFQTSRALRSGRYNRLDRSLQLDLADAPGLLNYNASRIRTSIIVLRPTSLISPHSQAAVLSQHWSPQQAVLVSAGTAELTQLGLQRKLKPVVVGAGLAFIP